MTNNMDERIYKSLSSLATGAMTGKIKAMAVITVNNDGSVESFYDMGDEDAFKVIGSIDFLKHRIMNGSIGIPELQNDEDE